MAFKLDCDRCGVLGRVLEEIDAYILAKEHETRHPDHFVFILQAPP